MNNAVWIALAASMACALGIIFLEKEVSGGLHPGENAV